jgi:hypothetical protein
MKTPRELLLSQHRSIEPKLDEIRTKALSRNEYGAEQQLCPTNEGRAALLRSPIPLFLRCLETIWRELIFPARRIWAGFAVVWLAILVINIAMSDRTATPAMQAKGKAAPANAFAAWREQQRILAELNGVSDPADGEKPKPFGPRPHSEGCNTWRTV